MISVYNGSITTDYCPIIFEPIVYPQCTLEERPYLQYDSFEQFLLENNPITLSQKATDLIHHVFTSFRSGIEGLWSSAIRAKALYEKNARKREAIFLYNIAFDMLNKPKVSEEKKTHAFALFSKSAELDSYPLPQVGYMYEGGIGVNRCYLMAAETYQKAIDSGELIDGFAEYRLGLLYLHGQGVRQSETKAMELFQASANLGYSHAKMQLGSMLSKKKETLPEGKKWIEKAANEGPFKLLFVGLQYEEGKGVQQSDELAAKLYEKCLELPEAQYRYAMMLKSGRGVRKSIPDALKWLEESAKSGHKEAMYNLGLIYDKGIGQEVPKSYTRAMQWFLRAAQEGHQRAKERLGLPIIGGVHTGVIV